VTAVAGNLLQDGIYFGGNDIPRRFFAVVFLQASPGARADTVADAVAGLWGLYKDLERGRVPDLRELCDSLGDDEARALEKLARRQGVDLDYAAVPTGRLQTLVGLGAPLFGLPGRAAGASALPKELEDYGFDPPVPAAPAPTPIRRGSGIAYEPGSRNLSEAALAFQFTADTLLAVERAVVETWKYLSDHPGALAVCAAYTGARRDDGRSWIDFHDGASNLQPAERRDVIEIPAPDDPRVLTLPDYALPHVPGQADAWTIGGTYLAFMRLYIDLAAWRALGVEKQEALVGRRKLSGFPLLTATEPFPDAAAWRYRDSRYVRPQHEADPTQVTVAARLDSEITLSHVQRANRHNAQPGDSVNPMNHRIFRQSYPFLEPRDGDPPFRVGLNFVSFQWTPASLVTMLSQPGWLGGTNFGGPSLSDGGTALLSARAAGVFLLPPCRAAPHGGERFPGERALLGA
jgi:deferrochelatase/peroxidase EfeB